MEFLTHLPSPHSPSFSEALRIATSAGTWVLVSGQVGVPFEKGAPAIPFADEVRACFERIRASLKSFDLGLEHVVKIQAYLTDLAIYGEYSRIRGQFFPRKPPTSTAVQVAGLLLGAKIEIDAVAFVPEGRDG
jgi:2-iminobutanoate/2-iminopropanoate deaminase